MTNEKKAKEIVSKIPFSTLASPIYKDYAYDAALKMAEWKEQQMIEKIQDFLANWFYEHPHTQMVCSDEFKSVDDLLERCKKAMEE